MEREYSLPGDDETIDLGTVSTETRGPVGPRADLQLGQFIAGLNDD